jgi:hypothetical protein
VTVQIDRYVTAIGETDEAAKGLVDKIKALELEHVALEGRLQLIDAENCGAVNVVSLHPVAPRQIAGEHRDHPRCAERGINWRGGGAIPRRIQERL